MEEITDYFAKFGLTQYESSALASIFEHPNSVAEQIAEEAEIPYTKVYGILTSLEKRGFLKTTLERPKKYIAVSPSTALDILFKNKQNELAYLGEVRKDCEKKLDSVYKKGESLNSDEKVIYLPSEEATWDGVHNFVDFCKISIDTVGDKHVWQELWASDKKVVLKGLQTAEKGVKYRCIAPSNINILDLGITLPNIKFILHPNVQLRIIDCNKIHNQFMIADKQKAGMAFINVKTKCINSGIILYDLKAVEGMVDYFNTLWEQAEPLSKIILSKIKEKLKGK